jgi:hypothetical protein
MKFQLIDGLYNTREALELLGDLVRVKMAYLENRIHASLSEEDI